MSFCNSASSGIDKSTQEVKMLKLLSIVALTLSICNSWANQKVIYGKDARVEVYSAEKKWQNMAMSTAALISLENLKYNKTRGTYQVSSLGEESMGEKLNLCSDVRFKDQINISTCSGFLVKDDVLLTAGHCATGEMKDICSSGKYAWVFGYQAKEFQDTRNIEIPKSNIVKCTEVLKATMNRTIDFAAIKLSRKLKRKPLKLNKSKDILANEKLVVIGTPWGLPTKVSLDGGIINNKSKYYFTASLDTFQGNSGSAVFNSRTGLVEGILVRGKTDAVSDEDTYCRRVNHCDNNGNNCSYTAGFQVGEDVMRMPFVYKKISSSL